MFNGRHIVLHCHGAVNICESRLDLPDQANCEAQRDSCHLCRRDVVADNVGRAAQNVVFAGEAVSGRLYWN